MGEGTQGGAALCPGLICVGPFGPGGVAGQLGQTAIGNSRIQRIDEEAETVTFSYRNNHGKRNEWGHDAVL